MISIASLARRFWAVMLAISLAAAVPIGDMAFAAKKPPPDVRSTHWYVVGNSVGALKGVGKFKELAPIDVYFGPLDFVDAQQQVIFSLPADRFIVVSDLQSILIGTYTQTPKGALICTPDTDSMQGFVEELLEVNIDSVDLDVQTVDILRLKTSGKVKSGKTGDVIVLKMAVKFAGTGTADGEFGAGKGAYGFGGKGTRVEL